MSNLVESPYPIFLDLEGKPLEDGYIFIGEPGLSPISNPMQAYWDTTLLVPANDIRTKGGYPYNSGTPGRLYTDTNYSIVVQDKRGSTIYTKLNSLDYSNALSTGTVSTVDTLADLREITPGEDYVQISVAGGITAGDGEMGPLYYWEPTSLEADNDSSVIKPTTVAGAGRWLWIGTKDTLAIETISITSTLDLGQTSKIFFIDSASNTVQTIPDGNFQGQYLTIVRQGVGTVEITGTDIPANTLIETHTRITWLDAGWTGDLITGVDATNIEATTIEATTIEATTIEATTIKSGGSFLKWKVFTKTGTGSDTITIAHTLDTDKVVGASVSVQNGADGRIFFSTNLATSRLSMSSTSIFVEFTGDAYNDIKVVVFYID